MGLGIWEIAAIGLIAMLFFGPSRLPQMGKSIGEAIRGFKKGLNEPSDEEQKRLARKEEGKSDTHPSDRGSSSHS